MGALAPPRPATVCNVSIAWVGWSQIEPAKWVKRGPNPRSNDRAEGSAYEPHYSARLVEQALDKGIHVGPFVRYRKT